MAEEKKTIRVQKKDCTTKDGRKFTAWETTDKSGRRVSVHFCQGTNPPEGTSMITLDDAWMDKRYTFPLLRVRAYTMAAEVKNVYEDEELPF